MKDKMPNARSPKQKYSANVTGLRSIQLLPTKLRDSFWISSYASESYTVL